jgi:ankyrin repeat protein
MVMPNPYNHSKPFRWMIGTGIVLILSVSLSVFWQRKIWQDRSDLALLRAAQANNTALAAQLLRSGASIDAGDPANAPSVWEQIQARLDNDEIDREYGETPLMLASEQGHAAMVQFLLLHGANANARDTDGYTPLLFAVEKARQPDTEVVRMLLQAGAAPNAHDYHAGDTALETAEQRHLTEIIRLLQQAGARE